MAQIRSTIELLTKVLNENGTSKIKAEIFRLSKFNNRDAVAPLWKLVFELLYYCEYGKIDNTSVKACGELSPEEMVVYVKRELQKKGFYSKEFALLPNDMSVGSREILLALGWLLCKENIIARFMKNCTSPLDNDTGGLYEETAPTTKPNNQPTGPQPKPDMYSKVQQLLWLNNKLQLNLRSLLSLQREKNILKHRIHEATYGVAGSPDRNHLSQMEVYMLRHPELLRNNIELLETDNERLQNLLKWKDHEDIFWRWMGSVLDAKVKDRQASQNPAAGDGLGTGCDFPAAGVAAAAAGDATKRAMAQVQSAVYARLRETHLSLQEAIIKYEAIVDHLENIWEDKSSDVTDEELDSVLSSIDLELSVQRANIALSNCRNYLQDQTPEQATRLTKSRPPPPPRPPPPNFILQKKTQNKSLNTRLKADTSPLDERPLSGIGDIEAEIRALNDVVDKMQRDVDDKQNSFKKEMQTLSTKFQDAICIPPMARKF